MVIGVLLSLTTQKLELLVRCWQDNVHCPPCIMVRTTWSLCIVTSLARIPRSKPWLTLCINSCLEALMMPSPSHCGSALAVKLEAVHSLMHVIAMTTILSSMLGSFLPLPGYTSPSFGAAIDLLKKPSTVQNSSSMMRRLPSLVPSPANAWYYGLAIPSKHRIGRHCQRSLGSAATWHQST